MATYELIGLDEATPRLLAPTANDTGSIVGSLAVSKDISDARGFFNNQLSVLAKSVRVSLSGAASGSSGVQILSDGDINPGVNGFTILHTIKPSGYTSSSGTRHVSVTNSADSSVALPILMFVLSGGNVTPRLNINTVSYNATTSITSAQFFLGARWGVAYTPPTPSADGSVVFYKDGVVFGSSVAVPAGTPHTFTGSNLLLEGEATTREPGDWFETILFNRTLSGSEMLLASAYGPAFGDVATGTRIPSQTATTSWTWTNYAGAPGFETFTTSSSDITSAINTSGLGIATAPFSISIGKRYRAKFSITVNSGSVQLALATTTDLSSSGQYPTTITASNDGDLSVEFTASANYSYLGFYSTGSSNFSVSGLQVQQIGVVGWWSAEDAQSNSGQAFDASGNKNHALLPASGATVIGASPGRRRQVRWTNTWSGTHELQYIGGVNQAILPSNAYIESIVGTVSGATVEDIIIGDGSDTDRYVTITTGLAAGTSSFTLANRTTDGTNLKLTVDPDANATMSIAWVITYYTLEG